MTATTDTNVSFTLPLAEPGPILPASASPDTTWKRVETEAALDLANFFGLGPSKKQRIIDMVPTMGDFERLRWLARKANRHLAQMLPKGIGEDVADELENRAIAWLASWGSKESQGDTIDTSEAGGATSGEGDNPDALDIALPESESPTTISTSPPIDTLPAIPELVDASHSTPTA